MKTHHHKPLSPALDCLLLALAAITGAVIFFLLLIIL